jgi:hypothetical protein
MPKKLQTAETKPDFEFSSWRIFWNLAFGVWNFAPASLSAESLLNLPEAGAC